MKAESCASLRAPVQETFDVLVRNLFESSIRPVELDGVEKISRSSR
jgi:hypothetical protein